MGALALALLVVAVTAVGVGRAASRTTDFGPAAAASLRPSSLEGAAAGLGNDVLQRDRPRDPVLSPDTANVSAAPTTTATAAATAAPTEETIAVAAPPVVETVARPTIVPVKTPAPPAATPVPALGSTCPATWFCFPRVGLAGPIVPYGDCSGSTDVGTSIRSYTCLSDHYLMGHAYTSFGLIRQWTPGDVVYAYGNKYTLTAALVQSACAAPVFPLAPLSLQTSLTSQACGQVLVVQGR
jgi:hypothetical protein